jgi:hypothetical protein
MEDLVGVNELELDAVRARRGCLVDKRPRMAKVAPVGSAQLSNDETGLTGTD